MAMTPRDIQNMRFTQKMRGYDAQEVESFLTLAAEELQQVLAENERLQRDTREQRERLRVSEDKEKQLQEALLRAQRIADEIVSTARREAQLLVKEAELTGDKIVDQALEQSTHIEARIAELRTARREVQLKFRNTIDLFGRILEADMAEEDTRGATVHALPRKRK
jgi:cell division initiation protein